MPTIIDSLIVALTLDPKGFNKGRSETSAGFKKTREEAAATGKELEVYGKRASSFFSSLRNEAVGLFLAFQGASTVTDFVKQLIVGDAATGRLARNIGIATNELSAWQMAVKSVGGDTRDADTALTAMAEAFQSWQLTGTTGHDADFKGLGVTLKDLENPAQALLKIAEAGERMDKTEFFARLRRIGIPESTINLLEKGRSGVEGLIAAKIRDGAATDANADAAARFEARLVELEGKITGMVRPSLYGLVTTMLDFLTAVEQGRADLPSFNGFLVTIGVTAALIGAPFVALAAAIALVATNIGKLKSAWKDYSDWYEGLAASTDPIFDPVRRALGMQTGAERRGYAGGGGDIAMVYEDGSPVDLSSGRAKRGGMGESWGASLARQHAAISGGGGSLAQRAEAILRQNGFTAEQARGIAAGIHAEGGSLGRAANGAFGIGQWRGSRQKALLGQYGPAPSFEQQMAFLIRELNGGDPGGASVRGSRTAMDTLSNYIGGHDWGFMRPGAGRAGDMQRGAGYLGMTRPRAPAGGDYSRSTSSTTSVGTIIVHTAATDAAGIAAELPGAIGRRGLTTQANRGLD